MESTTKIDIIGLEIYAYNELENTKEIYPLTSVYDFFINEFSDTQELLSVNISNPIARIVKFYGIENSIPKSYKEIEFQNMSEKQKSVFNRFVNIFNSK